MNDEGFWSSWLNMGGNVTASLMPPGGAREVVELTDEIRMRLRRVTSDLSWLKQQKTRDVRKAVGKDLEVVMNGIINGWAYFHRLRDIAGRWLE